MPTPIAIQNDDGSDLDYLISGLNAYLARTTVTDALKANVKTKLREKLEKAGSLKDLKQILSSIIDQL